MEKKLSETSGASKRKRKEAANKLLEKQLQKIPRLTTFFKPLESTHIQSTGASASVRTQSASSGDESESATNSMEGQVSALEDSQQTVTVVEEEQDNSHASEQTQTFDKSVNNLSETENNSNTNDSSLTSILKENYPSDFAHFTFPLTANHKKIILDLGPCRPQGPFPRDNKDRCFSTSFYKTASKSGFQIENTWLCYSPKLNVVYCEPCWLFSVSRESGWITGINDWQGLSKKIKKHVDSQNHTRACLVKEQWKKQKGTVDSALESTIQVEMTFWGKVLERLIKITLKLAKNSNSFRGHREHIDDIYNGNFLSDVKLMAEYDPVLHQVVNLPNGTIKYLSPQIQNELVDTLSNNLRRLLLQSIKAAPYFSIIIDTTQDLGKVDQMSVIYRYVKTKGQASKIESLHIEECFLGFYNVKDQTAAGISTDIVNIIKNCGLNIAKCRGQGYDGASTMSGIYTGVQSRIKQLEENAIYVHCAAHNLNLVVNDAMSGVTEVRDFFTTLQELYVYFGISINRWDILSSITNESETTLKRLNPTRWAGRLLSCMAIKLRFSDVVKALTKIHLESSKKDEREQAISLKQKIENFEFVFLLSLVTKLLSGINLTSKILQSEDIDIAKAAKALDNTFSEISKCRESFTEIHEEAKCVAKKWGIDINFKDKRVKKAKKHFDELSSDYRFDNAEHFFRINIFYKVIDIILVQIKSRFEGLQKISNLFSFIQPQNLIKLSDSEVMNRAQLLQETYKKDISAKFSLELVLFKNTFKNEIQKLQTIKDLAELILVEYSDMSSSFSEVISVFVLFLTLPVTVAKAERSFSKLKLIKNYLRTTMSQERLSALALLSIEAKEAAAMDVTDIIKDFASIKARRKTFF